MAITQQHRFIAVGTPLGEDVLLLRNFSYSESLSSLFAMELDLVREKADVKFSDIIGQNVTVRLRMGKDKERYFNGYVSRFSCVGHEEGFARYNATVVPWLWFLTQTSDCRIFQDKTVPQIIEEVFSDPEYAGIVDVDKKGLSRKDYRQWEYCVQYRETDLNFVSRLMEQEGIYYYWKHENGGHTMVLADDPSVHEPYPNYESIPYYPPTEELRKEEHVFQWDVEQEVRPRVYTHTDFNFKTPRTDLKASRKWKPPHVSPELEIFDYPGEYTNADEGGAYARTRIEEIQREYETLRGETTARGISPGFTFKLTNHPSQEQQRNYLVTRVSLSATSSGFYSGETGEEDFSCSFTAIDASKPYRHPRTTPKPSIAGPQTAIVTGPKGQEIWPDEYARVKVQFHWDRYGKSDENSSCWIRVAQLWAGKSWGGMAIPRIGQEVIVEFLEGDPDQPIITGRVYNAQCMPPYGLPGKKVVSGMKSNSTPGGGGYNEISMDDTKGTEKITVHGQYDMNTTIEHDQTDTIHNNRTTTVDVDDTETIGSNQKVSVGADQMVEVGANQTLSVGSNQDVTIGANRSLTVGGSETTTISGSRTLTVSGSESITISGDRSLTVAGGKTITVGANLSASAGANTSLVSGANTDISAGAKINITGGASVTISAGGSSLKIDAGGLTLTTGGLITEQASLIKHNT